MGTLYTRRNLGSLTTGRYALVPLLLVEVLSYVRVIGDPYAAILLTVSPVILNYPVPCATLDRPLRGSRTSATPTASRDTDLCWIWDHYDVHTGCQSISHDVQRRTCVAMLHDLQD